MRGADPQAPPGSRALSGWLHALRYGATGGALILVGFAAGLFLARVRSEAPRLPDFGPAPHYTLTNQLGETVSSARFAGKVQVVTFLFPYCTTYCPLIAAHLIGLGHLLQQSAMRDRVEIVAFNVAPGEVGPKQMREFLAQYGWNAADPHWQFLTGTPAQIHSVVTGGYHVDFERVADAGRDSEVEIEPGQAPQLTVANPLAEKMKPDFDILHNDTIEIVGPDGRVRRIYDDADVVSNETLWNDIQLLLQN